MARPRETSDEELLEAAARAIGRKGPVEFTLREAADEAGVTAATLIQRFGTKRGLLLAVVRGSEDTLAARFREAAAAHPNRLDAIVEALVQNAAPLSGPGEPVQHLAFLQLDLRDAELLALTRAYFREMRRCVRELAEEAVERGELARETDLDALARMVETAYNGALVTWAVHREGPLARSLREALALVLRRS